MLREDLRRHVVPKKLIASVMLGLGFGASAELKTVPREPQSVFSGKDRTIEVVFRNAAKAPVETTIRARLFQLTSATAAPVMELPSKPIRILEHQTIVENVVLDVPAVRAPTRFALRWTDGEGRNPGATEVLVYPPDVLKDLKGLLGSEPLGIIDPENQLKPILSNIGIQVEDLESSEVEDYNGKLLIAGPFASSAQVPARLGERLRNLKERGVASVWIQPRPRGFPSAEPSYFVAGAPDRTGIVVATADTVADIRNSPQAQLRLLKMASLAVSPKLFELPATKE